MGDTSENPQADKSTDSSFEKRDNAIERGGTFTRILVCKTLNLGGGCNVFNEQHRGLEESSESENVQRPDDGSQITEGSLCSDEI